MIGEQIFGVETVTNGMVRRLYPSGGIRESEEESHEPA
jgi:hypothetical protein